MAEKAAPPPEESIEINGIVKRSSGAHTVWVNGQALTPQSDGIASMPTPMAGDPGRALVTSRGMSRGALAVGEVLDPGTGQRGSSIRAGTVVTVTPLPQHKYD